VTIDLVCGDPSFLDMTFAGLDGLPGPGEERHATDFTRSPGGGATVAIGASRLGLSAAVAAPLGADADGTYLRAALEAEGVICPDRTVARTSVTAVMPWDGERAMATFEPEYSLTAADLDAMSPSAVVLSLARVDCAPTEPALFVTCGDAEARRFASATPRALFEARALIINAREASLLTGREGAEDALAALADLAPRVVVTLGPEGAISMKDGEMIREPGIAVDAVDTTGAGDLFTASYIWADLGGASPEERLKWACLAAAMSIQVPTAVGGAPTLVELADAGLGHGLELPARYLTAAIQRRDG